MIKLNKAKIEKSMIRISEKMIEDQKVKLKEQQERFNEWCNKHTLEKISELLVVNKLRGNKYVVCVHYDSMSR